MTSFLQWGCMYKNWTLYCYAGVLQSPTLDLENETNFSNTERKKDVKNFVSHHPDGCIPLKCYHSNIPINIWYHQFTLHTPVSILYLSCWWACWLCYYYSHESEYTGEMKIFTERIWLAVTDFFFLSIFCLCKCLGKYLRCLYLLAQIRPSIHWNVNWFSRIDCRDFTVR